MNRTEIGRMIRYERAKANISLQKMAAGVCSTAALQRLESGERLPDFFVLERLIERLGKSVNKTEFLYDEPAHEICYLRERIELFLEQKNEEEAARALDYYESTPQAGEPLHRQYICQMRAVIESELRNNHRAAEKLLEEALAQTVPGFDLHRLEACVLGEGELILALMLLEAADDRGAAFIRTGADRCSRILSRYAGMRKCVRISTIKRHGCLERYLWSRTAGRRSGTPCRENVYWQRIACCFTCRSFWTALCG